jgi:hypothetical protein
MRRWRRGLWLLGPLTILCGAALLAVWLAQPPPPYDRENYARVQAGMTGAEVRAILGRPRMTLPIQSVAWLPRPGERPVSVFVGPNEPIPTFLPQHQGPGTTERLWVSEAGLIAAAFDADGRLIEAYFSTVHLPAGYDSVPWYVRLLARPANK